MQPAKLLSSRLMLRRFSARKTTKRSAVIFFLGAGLSPSLAGATIPCPEDGFRFSLVHTNDLHSSFVGANHNHYFTEDVGDNDPVKGHYGRLAHLLRGIRQNNQERGRPTLTLDSGDFFAGTLFHMLAPSPETEMAPEWDFFAYARYDAVTLGNHEFDAGYLGFLNLLKKNKHLNVVASNARRPACDSQERQCALLGQQLHDSLVRELRQDGKILRVGILGLLGPNAAKVSIKGRGPLEFVGFRDSATQEDWPALIRSTQKQIDRLYAEDRVDVVLLIVHAGAPEDKRLAQELRGVHAILGGHQHEAYARVKNVNGVILAQAGSHGRFVGHLDVAFSNNKLCVENPTEVLVPVNDSVPVDSTYMTMLNAPREAIDEFARGLGYAFDSPIFTTEIDLPRRNEPRNPWGTLVMSAIREALNQELETDTDIYMSSLAAVRSDLQRVNDAPTVLQFSDVFQLLPLGFSEGYEPGYPIVSFYLTKRDIRTMVKFFELYRRFDPLFTPVYSDSLTFHVHSWGIPMLNRIKNLRLHGNLFREWPDLVRVSTSSLIASYFYRLGDLTRGLIRLQPKDALGQPIDEPPVVTRSKEYLLFVRSMEDRILRDAAEAVFE